MPERHGSLKRWDARAKLLTACAALLIAIAAPSPLTPLFLACAAWTTASLFGERSRQLRSSISALLFFGGIAVALKIVLTGGEEWLGLNAFAHHVKISRQGIDAGFLLAARIVGSTSIFHWLLSAADFNALAAALAWLKIPRPLVELLVLAQRNIAGFGEIVRTAHAAQTLRFGHSTLHRRLSSSGILAGIVIVRAVNHAEMTGCAMQMRGYAGRLWIPACRPFRREDLGLAAVAALILGLSLFLPRGVGL